MTGTLADRFRQALAEAVTRLDGTPALAPVRAMLAERAALCDARLRVAVVGRVSQGKSTLVNALIGKPLTPTGTLELSYSVTHIRYGSPPSLTVHYKNGTTEVTSIDQLKGYAGHRGDNRDLLASIAYLDVVSDQPYLRGFDLIDTAGLDSALGEDSAVTLEYLRKSREELAAETTEEADKADALILVMGKRGLSTVDTERLRAFLGPESAGRSPVTTIGVMTKIEDFWTEDEDPETAARQYRVQMLKNADVRSMLFEIMPVCGKLAETAVALDDADVADLRELGRSPKETLERSLQVAQVFVADDRGLPLTTARRGELYAAFTGYGLKVATSLIRANEDITAGELREQLQAASGISSLRDRLTSHFAHRADLLKTKLTSDLTLRAERSLSRNLGRADRGVLDGVTAMITAYRDELGLAELELLQRVQTGALPVSPADREEILHLIGEYGKAVHSRLELPANASLTELETRAGALHDRWRRDGDALVGRESADTLVRRCSNLKRDIRVARSHLEDPQ
ncbi:MAG TPA: dynamin family protein [Trebonia sp.]|nr:dynamin family protein [Trebonia sp.]